MEKVSTFAERLKAQLEEKHFTLAELGRLARVDRSLMTKYCKGTNHPKIETIRRLASVLYVNPEWLEGYNVDKTPKPVQLSPIENDLILDFRSCDAEDKYIILEFVKNRRKE